MNSYSNCNQKYKILENELKCAFKFLISSVRNSVENFIRRSWANFWTSDTRTNNFTKLFRFVHARHNDKQTHSRLTINLLNLGDKLDKQIPPIKNLISSNTSFRATKLDDVAIKIVNFAQAKKWINYIYNLNNS